MVITLYTIFNEKRLSRLRAQPGTGFSATIAQRPARTIELRDCQLSILHFRLKFEIENLHRQSTMPNAESRNSSGQGAALNVGAHKSF